MGLPEKGTLKPLLAAVALGVALTATGAQAEKPSQQQQAAAKALADCSELPKCADVFEFKDLKTVRIYGDIDGSKDIVTRLKMLDESLPKEEIIRVVINSPGGWVGGGRVIYDTMMSMKHDIETVCEGQCASMAAALLAAGTPGKRAAMPDALIMVHDARYFNLGNGTWRVQDIEELHKQLERSNDFVVGILSRHTGINRAAMDAFAKEKDQWLTAEEAVRLKIVDRIEQPRRQPPYLNPDKPLPQEFQDRIKGYKPS